MAVAMSLAAPLNMVSFPATVLKVSIIELDNANQNIRIEAQKRLNRDFSD